MVFGIIFLFAIAVIGILLTIGGMREFYKDHYEPKKVLIRTYLGVTMFGVGYSLLLFIIINL